MFRKYFSLNKGLALYYKQIRIPFQYEYYVPTLVKIGPVVFKKKLKMFVVYRWTDRRTNTDGQTNGRTTDNGWSETFSSGELKTKGANKNKKGRSGCVKFKRATDGMICRESAKSWVQVNTSKCKQGPGNICKGPIVLLGY